MAKMIMDKDEIWFQLVFRAVSLPTNVIYVNVWQSFKIAGQC